MANRRSFVAGGSFLGSPTANPKFAFHDARHRCDAPVKIAVSHVSFFYGTKQALNDVSLDIYTSEVIAFIGPSGCGKTTLLRCLNRMNDIIPGARLEGRILLDGQDLYASDVDPVELRRRFGWVAQKPNPFPSSVYRNIAYGPRIHGLVWTRWETDEIVEQSLGQVGLWEEVKDRLHAPATDLSVGQQQRLCIARAIATRPEVILMDEPCSALDPIATAKIESLIEQLYATYTVIIVTHNLQQAARVSQRTAFFHFGRLVELGDTKQIFMAPRDARTKAYITGRYG